MGKSLVVDYDTGEIYRFDVHQAIMLMAYVNLDGPQKEALATLYREKYVPAICEAGYEPVAERTFCRSLTSLPNRLKFDLFRHGTDYYNKHYLTYIPTEELTWAHSLFCGDGSGLISYRYMARERDKKTGIYREQTRTRNLYVVMITDVASGYIAGWGIAPEGSSEESFAIVQDAVRMAVDAGGRRTMFEFVSDNAPAFSRGESREWLANVFNRVRRIEPGNSQANPAETYFRLFKNVVLRSCKEFVRSSHDASIGGRANTDDMSVFDYPTYTEAIAVLEERIEVWNNRRGGDGRTPAERFAEKIPPARLWTNGSCGKSSVRQRDCPSNGCAASSPRRGLRLRVCTKSPIMRGQGLKPSPGRRATATTAACRWCTTRAAQIYTASTDDTL